MVEGGKLSYFLGVGAGAGCGCGLQLSDKQHVNPNRPATAITTPAVNLTLTGIIGEAPPFILFNWKFSQFLFVKIILRFSNFVSSKIKSLFF